MHFCLCVYLDLLGLFSFSIRVRGGTPQTLKREEENKNKPDQDSNEEQLLNEQVKTLDES
jgi:hypothetical protein